MKEDTRPLMVTIRCLTYNHEPYIRQCLDGFVMQRTNFRFEVIVHDDASTDGTAAIIREYAEKYPNIIKPIIEIENQYSKDDGSLETIMDEHTYGKYVAFCEGDDYWTHPNKLQMQLDFLEANPDYSMCFTDVRDYDDDHHIMHSRQSSKYLKDNLGIENGGDKAFFDIMLGKCRIQTLTVMVRASLLRQKEKDPVQFMMGDTQLWLFMSQKGKIKYIPECTGIYRQHSGSACRNPETNDLFRLSMFEMRVYYCNKYKYTIPPEVKRFYNLALANVNIKKIKMKREPMFKMFPMYRVQERLYNYSKKGKVPLFVFQIIWKIESLLSFLGLRNYLIKRL